MIFVGGKICINDNCLKNAQFNKSKNLKPVYCDIHNKEGMIKIYKYFCKINDCNSKADYG